MLRSKESIGRLDREITIIKPIIDDGDSNEDKIIGWEEIDTYPNVNARKIDGVGSSSGYGGNTVVVADRVAFVQQTNWVLRYRDDITVQMRIVYQTKMYQIVSVADSDEGRNRFIVVNTTLIDNEYFT